jgi:hypothetical protein
MDAYYIANKIQKYWMALFPKNSGELLKGKDPIKVCVMTEYGLREVKDVKIQDDFIQLILDEE